MEENRLKPVCLVIIDGFGVDHLSGDNENFLYFKKLAEIYPFFILRSTDVNVDYPWNSYIEIGTGTCIKDDVNRISLSEIIKDAGLRQLYVGESELYANLTYFFSDRKKNNDSNITKILISEAKSDSYINDSDMVASSITSKFLKEIEKKIYDFVVIGYSNFLNKDIASVSSMVSSKIKLIVDTILALNGILIITSNSSNVRDKNFVPLFLISKQYQNKSFVEHNHFKPLNQQILAGNTYDIAPTILKIMKISKLKELRGNSLI